MRGVRAWWKAPLVLLVALLATCDFILKIEQPSLDLDFQAAYQSGNSVQITYTFTADEPVLQCRWAVNSDSEEIDSGTRGPLTSGVPDTLELSIPEDGNYLLHLVGQVKRNGSFVDMATLSQTVEFSIDSDPPEPPYVGMVEGGCYLPTDQVLLNHFEWDNPGTSPVNLRYNFDAGPFEPGAVEVSKQAGGVPISFPQAVVDTAGVHTLQVTAIDEAGNYPAPDSKQFRLLIIQSAIDDDSGPNKAQIGSISNVDIKGYTFSASDTVKLYDSDETVVPYYGSPIIGATLITVAFNLRIEAGTFVSGMGHIDIQTTTPNVLTIQIPFELTSLINGM